jgi:DNA-binding NarL/FixJ family response regulator
MPGPLASSCLPARPFRHKALDQGDGNLGVTGVGLVRVLVAVPHPLLREGIRKSLAGSAWTVHDDATDAGSAVRLAGQVEPHACLVDADLTGCGLSAVGGIVRTHPPAAVVVIADRGSHLDVLDSVRAGAVGYLDKDVGSACLPRALRAALAGEPLIPRRLVQDLVREIRLRPARQTVADWAPVSLTRREFDVLDLMRAGLSTAAIAERLFVSPGTVRSHVMSMKRKLHAEDRAALVRCGGGGIPGRAAAR